MRVRYVQKLQKRKDDERMGIFFIVAIVQLDIERQQTHISNNLEFFSSNQKQYRVARTPQVGKSKLQITRDEKNHKWPKAMHDFFYHK